MYKKIRKFFLKEWFLVVMVFAILLIFLLFDALKVI